MERMLGKPSVLLADKCKNIATALVVSFVWVVFIAAVLNSLSLGGDLNILLGMRSPTETFFMACVWAPIWEEFVFRWAPIKLARAAGGATLLPIIIIASAIFGWGHGAGPYSLLIQGAMGLVFSVLYIKNNDSVLSTIIAHSMWNTFVIFILQ